MVLGERPTPNAGDLEPASTSADNHALAVGSREPSAHEVDHLCGREAMRPYDRLGAAVGGGREQFERAAAAGLEVAMRAAAGSGGRHVARLRWRSEDHGLRGPHMATPFFRPVAPPASR